MNNTFFHLKSSVFLNFLQINLVWGLFNHLAKPYLPASLEFFQILLLMESGVLLLAVIYLLVFAGKKTFSFQVAAEVLYHLFTGLHHFVYV